MLKKVTSSNVEDHRQLEEPDFFHFDPKLNSSNLGKVQSDKYALARAQDILLIKLEGN